MTGIGHQRKVWAMRKIKLFPAPHVELRVSVSDEMEEDYRECKRLCNAGDDKDCDTCSWHEVEIPDTRMCELDAMEQLLEDNYG